MSDEDKTEEPSQKRLSDSIEKGKGPVYRDLTVLFGIGAIWLSLTSFIQHGALQVAIALRLLIDRAAEWRIASEKDIVDLLGFTAEHALGAILPILGIFALAALTAGLAHSRGFIGARLKPTWSNLSPIAGWSRLFGSQGLSNSLKSLLKIAVVGAIAVQAISTSFEQLLTSDYADPGSVPALISEQITNLVRSLIWAFLAIAALDVVIARRMWLHGLRMSKQEIKDEAKESDGDPVIKARLRQLARKRMKQHMMAAVPKATVVIVNPTHVSVALRYVREEGGAPRVVAKGEDAVALKIRELATQNGIPLVEDRHLARALYKSAPVDALIPPEFYKAVAHIIAHLARNSTSSAHKQRS